MKAGGVCSIPRGFWGPLQSRELWSLPLCGWYWWPYTSSSLFLATSRCLSLFVSSWSETKVGSSCSALKGWGSWLFTPLSFSQWEELSGWEVPSWQWKIPSWWMGWCRQNETTVDPWTTQVWTAWVHLYMDFFFNSKYYSTTWSICSCWICRYGGTADIEEPWIWRANYKLKPCSSREESPPAGSRGEREPCGSLEWNLYLTELRGSRKGEDLVQIFQSYLSYGKY